MYYFQFPFTLDASGTRTDTIGSTDGRGTTGSFCLYRNNNYGRKTHSFRLFGTMMQQRIVNDRLLYVILLLLTTITILLLETAASVPMDENIASRRNRNTNTDVPTWEELDERPLPQWYDDAKFGIFIHWGVFSVPSYGSEWFWMNWKGSNFGNSDSNSNSIISLELEGNEYEEYIQNTERQHFTYQEYASRFRAELYRPKEWAQTFAQSGAQYVVLTSKHHDGYCT
jgi:Alpha-L-fucosidase